ncbi:MAG: hypothetical protein PHE27_04820 [Alphaproteobacteria bacterium]|nr:hypothetical protein [Alphaproteobacteria bacterium]
MGMVSKKFLNPLSPRAAALEKELHAQEAKALLLLKEKAEADRRMAEDAARLAKAKPGEFFENRGIFAGTWAPRDRDNVHLRQTYYVFAAPVDLSGRALTWSFVSASKELASRKNWYGHDGVAYRNDTELFDALRTKKYRGEWFISPVELLTGEDADGKKVRENGLIDLKDVAAFSKTLCLGGADDSDDRLWYLTCSASTTLEDCIKLVHLSGGWEASENISADGYSCRPFRLELAGKPRRPDVDGPVPL